MNGYYNFFEIVKKVDNVSSNVTNFICVGFKIYKKLII